MFSNTCLKLVYHLFFKETSEKNWQFSRSLGFIPAAIGSFRAISRPNQIVPTNTSVTHDRSLPLCGSTNLLHSQADELSVGAMSVCTVLITASVAGCLLIGQPRARA